MSLLKGAVLRRFLPYLTLISVLAAGCVTPYQDMGTLGGVTAIQVSSDTFQITARGNGYTDPDIIQRYALRKSAQATLDHGFDYFSISDTEDRSTRDQYSSTTVRTLKGRAFALSSIHNIFKPGETVLIKAYRGAPPDPLPMGIFDAKDVLKYLSSSDYLPPSPDEHHRGPLGLFSGNHADATADLIADACNSRGFFVTRVSALDIICQGGDLVRDRIEFRPSLPAQSIEDGVVQVYHRFIVEPSADGSIVNERSTIASAMPGSKRVLETAPIGLLAVIIDKRIKELYRSIGGSSTP